MRICEISENLRKYDFIFVLSTFLDEFKRSENKHELIATEPKCDNLTSEEQCILAAVSLKLANDCGINPPLWVLKEKYVMPYPVYAFNTQNKDFQKLLEDETPFEFKQRNLFVGKNAIERV